MKELVGMLESGQLIPPQITSFPIEKIQEAHKFQQSNSNKSSVVVVL